MNEFMEFIAWDKLGKIFFTDKEVKIESGKITMLYDNEWFPIKDEEVELFPYIGKTDDTPQKNKIYAGVSVVQFEILDRDINPYLLHLEMNNRARVVYTGYFQYYPITLKYGLVCPSLKRQFFFDRDYIISLKVIGTLQENPELLGETI